jgi:hypothetical protein
MEIVYDKKKNWQTSKGDAKEIQEKEKPRFPKMWALW